MAKIDILELAKECGAYSSEFPEGLFTVAMREEELRHYTKDIIEMIAKEAEKEDEFALSVGDIRKLKEQI